MRGRLIALLLLLAAPAARADQLATSIYRCGLGQFDAVPACTGVIDAKAAKAADKVTAYINRGAAYATAHDYPNAVADQNQAIALDPKAFEAYANRGLAERELGEPDKAVADFTQALALGAAGAEQMQILNARAATYAALGHDDLAAADYKAALAVAPNDVAASRGLTLIRNHRATKLAFEIGAGIVALLAIGATAWAARTRLRAQTAG